MVEARLKGLETSLCMEVKLKMRPVPQWHVSSHLALAAVFAPTVDQRIQNFFDKL